MVANKEKLRFYLESENLTAQDFARRLGVEQSEADKLLAGERVGYDTARKFVYYFRGVIAQHYEDDIFLRKMAEFMEQHNISTAEELFDALGKDNQKGGNGKGGYSM